MKVLIQGLGEVPATIEYALEKERPDLTHIICSEFQMKNVASAGGYTEPSQVVVERAARKYNTKVIWQTCDIFDIRSVGEAISRVFREIKPDDEIVINYTGGAASVKLLLGASAVVLSRMLPIRIVYALRYKGGIEVYKDQTDELKAIFKQLYEFF
ncbi:MAG: hypothetical protein QMD95_03885 [Candidatus Hodarchaeaceae archaeon]|nr:hypothetical protein [Candidatus Hodarchaeaceae archaeon]